MAEAVNEEKDKIEETETDSLSRCESERDEYLDGWKRAKAELLNYKKDEFRRLEEMAKYSEEVVVRELLPVLDSFDLALVSEDLKEDKKSERGIYLIRQQLKDALQKVGLEQIEVKIGDDFNPLFHEAVMQVEAETDSGKIAEEMERGYRLNGKVIRPARVKVSK